MTKLLEKAFAEAAKLSVEQQDAFAGWLLEELASEKRWEDVFAKSRDRLAQRAREALDEHRERKTGALYSSRS